MFTLVSCKGENFTEIAVIAVESAVKYSLV